MLLCPLCKRYIKDKAAKLKTAKKPHKKQGNTHLKLGGFIFIHTPLYFLGFRI